MDSKRELNALFNDIEEEEEITSISELPGIPDPLVALLTNNDIILIETLVSMTKSDLEKLEGITENDIELIESIIAENVDIVEEETLVADELVENESEVLEGEEETYECPECGGPITVSMTACPNCGVGLYFEEEKADDESSEEE